MNNIMRFPNSGLAVDLDDTLADPPRLTEAQLRTLTVYLKRRYGFPLTRWELVTEAWGRFAARVRLAFRKAFTRGW
jgi:hypothetical protein